MEKMVVYFKTFKHFVCENFQTDYFTSNRPLWSKIVFFSCIHHRVTMIELFGLRFYRLVLIGRKLIWLRINYYWRCSQLISITFWNIIAATDMPLIVFEGLLLDSFLLLYLGILQHSFSFSRKLILEKNQDISHALLL